jgi:hypothetical protein
LKKGTLPDHKIQRYSQCDDFTLRLCAVDLVPTLNSELVQVARNPKKMTILALVLAYVVIRQWMMAGCPCDVASGSANE